MGQLAKKLAARTPVLTVEISPPKGTDVSRFLGLVAPIASRVDAINIPDCQRAILKLSSLAAAKIVQDELGVEAVWQLTGRDRNVLALQSDLLGGWALGLQNVLALTGDPVNLGDQADVARQVSHVDALRLIELIQQLNLGQDATGKDLPRGGTQFCLGAALNPHRMARDAQKHRLAYKMGLGIQFFQTQPVYSVAAVQEVRRVLDTLSETMGVPRPALLIGIIPPKSAEFARFMNQKIVGIDIPPELIDHLDAAKDPVEASIAYCANLMHQLRPLVEGFHVMPVGMEAHTPALLDAFESA